MHVFLAHVDEIYVRPDQPEVLVPSQSIRHETKIIAHDIYLLQNERTIDRAQYHMNSNNLENRNDKNDFTKMIANGILAAEALEKSLINKTAVGIPNENKHDEPVRPAIEPLPVNLTPPRTILDRPFRNEHRILLRERNHSLPYVQPKHAINRFKNFNQPIRKGTIERQKVTKISMPPIRRDYTTDRKRIPPFPVQNQPWSLQKHIVAMRGGSSTLYIPKEKFSSPIKISKEEIALPAKNVGFKPDSVVVEGGFTPITRRASTEDNTENYSTNVNDTADAYDYPEQQQRRSDQANLNDENNSSNDDENSELLIKTFEPMFIPSPLDNMSINKSPAKRLTGDLQYMEMENGEDKMALAGEKHAYYLPPDASDKNNISKITKLYPAGTVVTYDGRALVDSTLLDSEPDFPTPHRPGSENVMLGIKSTKQLLHSPQFGPFHGEIPPLKFKLNPVEIRVES